MESHIKKGHLEVICGSMFSGKTEELMRQLRLAQYAKKEVTVFKHSLDKRRTIEYLSSHNGGKLSAIPTDDPEFIREFVTTQTNVIGIDEVQFFPQEIIDIIQELVENGKRVIVAGLDLDFRGIPFSNMPTLMAIADTVTKLKAICMICGKDAHFSQRIINGQPAKFDDPIIMIGASECYEARCRDCFQIDRKESLTALAHKFDQQQKEVL